METRGPAPPASILDELLVLRAQEGSRDALRLLITRWQERLWRHAYRLTGREDAAWDVSQESWIAITDGLRKLRDPAAFRRWAYTIVTRTATDRLRNTRVEETATSETIDGLEAAEAVGSDRDQAVAQLRAALRELPRDQRVLLSLRYLEDFSVADLAEVLDIPEGTVKSRLHHARNHLKSIIERSQ